MNATRATLREALWRWGRAPVIAAFSLLLLGTQAQAAPPTFVGVSGTSATAAAASTGGDVTVTLPAHQTGDILLLIGVVRDQNDTVTVSGWTQMTGSPFNRSTVSRYWIFWKRAASSSETPPVFDKDTTTGDTFVAVASYRGAIATGDPWEVKGTPATGTADPAACTGISTLTDDSLVVAALAGENDNNTNVTTTGTNPAAYVEHYLESPTGANGMIAFSEAARTTFGATGTVSVNFDTANPVGWGCMVLALKPPPSPTLSSAANQTFTLGDPPTLASVLTVTESTGTPTITATNNLRIRIPATFSMTWDTAVTTVTLGGTAVGKVNPTGLAYENSSQTVVLDVTSDFTAGQTLTISGLKFRDFTAQEAAANLELVVAGSGGATADQDDKTITIAISDVSSAGSRILNDNAGRTPVAAEDIDVTNWDKGTRFLVTIGIQTRSGSGARCETGPGANNLQWRNVTDAPGTWNNLGTAAGPQMILFDSANLVHGNSLSLAEAQIAGTGTYINGQEAENNTGTGISWSRFENGEYSAVQFPIDPSAGLAGKTYQFRFVVNGSLCDAGSNVMSVSITLATLAPAPGSFNAFETSTAAGAITGVIRTKVAGSAFSLDVVAIASGAQQASFTNAVTVELLGNNTLGVSLDAQNCPTSSTLVQTVTPNPSITGGRSTVSFAAVTNSWRDVRVRVRWPTVSPTVTWCSVDNFAIRPASFSAAVTDATWATAGTPRALTNVAASGGNVHKAGQPFTITVTPSPGTATNYSGDPTVSALACSLPTPCANGTLAVGTFSGSGTRVSSTATYTEVGAFNLTLIDQTFASVDSTDGTPADCSAAGLHVCHSGAPLAVGRFVPDHFDVTSVTAPVFRTFNDAACATRSFTYIGQLFGYATVPAATIAAKNSSGGTTTNYRGALWKLTNASASQTFANSPVMPLVTTGIAAPTVSETAGTGTGTYTANASDAIAFTRDNATPQALFNANLSLTVSVSDATEAGANQGTITTSTALVFNGGGTGIGFDSGNAFRYGRLALRNANGSQLVALPVPLETQYWNGMAFVTNDADNCTTIATNNVAMSNFTSNLAACETANTAVSAFIKGRSTLTLAAPGSANDGSVTLTANLGAATSGTTCTTVLGGTVPATGANRAYLQGNWTGLNYDQNPSGRETFGVYKGADEVIFIRENF